MRPYHALFAILLAGLTAPSWAQQPTRYIPNPTQAQPPGMQQPMAPAPDVPTANTGSAAQRFRDEASAQAHCPSDSIVWVNTRSGAVHAKGDRYYGHTRNGAYACQGEMPARAQRGASQTRRPTGQ